MPENSIRLTDEQAAALVAIKAFLQDDTLDAFILRGSAGTGKTTLIADVVAAVGDMRLSCALLAPTGRAARILGSKVRRALGSREAIGSGTIHAAIYNVTRLDVFEEAVDANDPGFRIIYPLKEDEPSSSLFVIDESSMVGDRINKGDLVQFGSGQLLSDVVAYARAARSGRARDRITKLLFVGDPAQLPPVGETQSPAMSDAYLRTEFGLKVASFDLTTVMRQAEGSAILERATELRDAISADCFNSFSLQPNGGDIEKIDAMRAVDLIFEGLAGAGSSVAVTYSNAMALDYNRSVRERRWGDALLPVQVGDILLVNRNSRDVLRNGDLVKVMEVAPHAEVVPIMLKGGHRTELHFRKLTVAYRDGDGAIIRIPTTVLENLLDSPNRELSAIEQRALLVHFRQRNPELNPKSAQFRKALLDDAYFNALQVKYGYAMTCHKAQGGEWDRVIVDFGGLGGNRNAGFFRWTYTAITRAVAKLAVVNPPEFTAMTDIQWPGPASRAAPQLSAEDLSSDPDWNRFSFSPANAELMPTHRKLRDLWAANGIEISMLQHLAYCERYTLVRQDQHATIQYHYNGRFQIGQAARGPGSSADPQLLEDALAVFAALAEIQLAPLPDELFIREFLDRLDAALVGSLIRRTNVESMPYRLRVRFADSSRKGAIDFTHSKKSTWTAAQEVGGPGGSRGLYEEIQRMMASVGAEA